MKSLILEERKNNAEERPTCVPTFDDVVTRLSGALALEVNRMPEPDVTVEGESTSLSTTTHFGDDDTFFLGGSDETQSLRKKSWDEERARLEAELARMKLAEENAKQLGVTLARKLEEKEQTIVSLEARLKENSAATVISTERQGGDGKEEDPTTKNHQETHHDNHLETGLVMRHHTTTMRLG